MVLHNSAHSAQVIHGNPGAGLRFDSQLHIINDEIDFNTTGEPPIGKLACSSRSGVNPTGRNFLPAPLVIAIFFQA